MIHPIIVPYVLFVQSANSASMVELGDDQAFVQLSSSAVHTSHGAHNNVSSSRVESASSSSLQTLSNPTTPLSSSASPHALLPVQSFSQP